MSHIDVSLRKVFDFCRHLPELRYVTEHFVAPMEAGQDPQGVCLDFVSYTQAMDEAQRGYFASLAKLREPKQQSPFTRDDWVVKQLHCIANCGRFSSDRTISDYCDEVWAVQDLSIPKGAATPVERVKSFPNVPKADRLREKMNTTQPPQSFIKQ